MQWSQVFDILSVVATIIAIGQAILSLIKRGADDYSTRTRSDYFWGVGLALSCAAIWSISYTSLSWATTKADAFEINVILLGVASVIYLVASLVAQPLGVMIAGGEPPQKAPSSLETLDLWKTFSPWFVLLGNIGSFLFFVWALYYISASQSITLQKVNPVFVALLVAVFLKQRVTGPAWLAIFLAVLGCVLITTDISGSTLELRKGDDFTGSVLAVLAGFSFAVFSVALEKLDLKQHSYKSRLRFLGIVFFVSFIIVLTVAYFSGRPPTCDSTAFWILIANGIRVSVVYLLYCAAVARIGALLTSVFVALEVFLTMLWDYLILQQVPPATLWLGALVIVASGITLIAKSRDIAAKESHGGRV